MFGTLFRGLLILGMFVSAGAASQTSLLGGAPTRVMLYAIFLLAAFAYRSECMKMGADPKRPLATGKHEIVYLKVWRSEYEMVTARHVDYGHYEHRYAEVSKQKFERDVELGDTIVVDNRFPFYDVLKAGAKG